MCSCRRRSGREGAWGCQNDVVVEVPPLQPYVNKYNGNNTLSIVPASQRSDNYFLIIGDWGTSPTPGACQWKVAQKMKAYVTNQTEAGKTLLAVLTVGDNFYWNGARPEFWHERWANVYGVNDPNSPMYGVPWLATLGNHDYGDNDPYAFCPDANPSQWIFDGQAYGSKQLNADRNPTRPEGTESFWIPDYNFHYEIPGVDLEFIFVDTNEKYLNHVIDTVGFDGAKAACDGKEVALEFLRRIKESGEELLKERARAGIAKTTVILQHYPEEASNTRRIFMEGMAGDRTSSVLSAWGHVHDQSCEGRDSAGNCDMVLTGGGGGCCLGAYAGFTAVHLNDDGGFTTVVDSSEVRIPSRECPGAR